MPASNQKGVNVVEQQLRLASEYENRCACAQGAIGSAAGLIAGLLLHFYLGIEIFADEILNVATICALAVFVGTGVGKAIGLLYFRYQAGSIRSKIGTPV